MIKLEKVEMDQIKRLRKRGKERSFPLFLFIQTVDK